MSKKIVLQDTDKMTCGELKEAADYLALILKRLNKVDAELVPDFDDKTIAATNSKKAFHLEDITRQLNDIFEVSNG